MVSVAHNRKGVPPSSLFMPAHFLLQGVEQQRNGSDGGVFLCSTVWCACRRLRPNFGQRHMPAFREHVKISILRAQGLGPPSRVPAGGVSGATHEIDLACVSDVHVYVCPSVQYSGTLKL